MNFDIHGIKEVDFDNVLEYGDAAHYLLTSKKFNTEHILIIPTQDGIELGLKVSFKNRQGNVCNDVRRITVAGNIPSICIGDHHFYLNNFTQDNCLVKVSHFECDEPRQQWFDHQVTGFPLFTRTIDANSIPVPEKSIFKFPRELEDTEYATPGYTLDYLSPKGIATIAKALRKDTNLQKQVYERIAGATDGKLSKNGIILLDLQELDTGVPINRSQNEKS